MDIATRATGIANVTGWKAWPGMTEAQTERVHQAMSNSAEIALRSMQVELDRAEKAIRDAIYAHDPYLEEPDQRMLAILKCYEGSR